MMKASSFEFRHRFLLHTAIFVLGFWAPWTYVHRTRELDVVSANTRVWSILASDLGAWMGPTSALQAFNIVLGIAIAVAVLAAFLRTWGSAYLGARVVEDSSMHTAASVPAGIIQDGPFRHLRNPLYLGTFLHTLALATLMPRSGAIFTIVLIGVLQLRLIGAEEHFLESTLGDAYDSYYDKVPSLIPALRPQVPGTGLRPRWGQAFVGEFYMWGAALSFAFLGWRYNSNLILQGVIVSLGISLILRVFTTKKQTKA